MAVLLLLAALLLLNVVVPQEGLGAASAPSAVPPPGAARFMLETLGFSHLSTSPLFVLVLGLFLLNLALVLVARAGNTLRRARFHPPEAGQLALWSKRPEAITFARPPGWDPSWGVTVLRGLGYRTASPGLQALWGVKNRAAVLGFPLFHLSFFVLCLGGLSLYYTRDVGTLKLVEGQTRDLTSATVVRRSPLGGAEPGQLTLEEVDPVIEGGKPIHLGVRLRLDGSPGQDASVNHPAQWADLTVLVDRAGLAPTFWLRDAAHYTVDRVAAPVPGSAAEGFPVPLAGGALEVVVFPIPVGERFPTRERLSTVALSVRVTRQGETLYSGPLRPGQSVRIGEHQLTLEAVHYWAGLRLVRERGGATLILGFLMMVVGLVWRMVWYRRELGLTWDETHLVLSGYCEFFPTQFREELESIRGLLEKPQSKAQT